MGKLNFQDIYGYTPESLVKGQMIIILAYSGTYELRKVNECQEGLKNTYQKYLSLAYLPDGVVSLLTTKAQRRKLRTRLSVYSYSS